MGGQECQAADDEELDQVRVRSAFEDECDQENDESEDCEHAPFLRECRECRFVRSYGT